jgi:hypothetical protein
MDEVLPCFASVLNTSPEKLTAPRRFMLRSLRIHKRDPEGLRIMQTRSFLTAAGTVNSR